MTDEVARDDEKEQKSRMVGCAALNQYQKLRRN
jgi:hypothetical protein